MSAPTHGRRRAARALAGLLLAGLLAACGVTDQEQPVRIEPDEVPFGLLRETPSGSDSASDPASDPASDSDAPSGADASTDSGSAPSGVTTPVAGSP